MIRVLLRPLLSTVFLLLIAAFRVYAQGEFLYAKDGSCISAFAVGSNGGLTEITGSPFCTGQLGGGLGRSFDNMAISRTGSLLFVANGGSANISVFSINPATGVLTQVPGSPFATRMLSSAISVAPTPDTHFLFAASDFGQLARFSIAPNGALTLLPGSELFYGRNPSRISVSPNGKFMSWALPDDNEIDILSIAADGTLTSVAGSPFALGNGKVFSTEFNCATSLLFAGQGFEDVFDVAANGALTRIPGSPFNFPNGARTVLLSPNEHFLFGITLPFGTITALRVAANGSLSAVPGSPFFVGDRASDRVPIDLAINRAGTLLYTANGDGTISVFSIANTGILTPVAGSPFNNGSDFASTLAAYPPKGCGMANGFDLCIQDESNGNLLQINTTTAAYEFTNCTGLTIGGAGVLTKRGSQITLQHNSTDRRVVAKIDITTSKASASIQLLSAGRTFSITDRNITNNTCACR